MNLLEVSGQGPAGVLAMNLKIKVDIYIRKTMLMNSLAIIWYFYNILILLKDAGQVRSAAPKQVSSFEQ